MSKNQKDSKKFYVRLICIILALLLVSSSILALLDIF